MAFRSATLHDYTSLGNAEYVLAVQSAVCQHLRCIIMSVNLDPKEITGDNEGSNATPTHLIKTVVCDFFLSRSLYFLSKVSVTNSE